jgi:hypothetical protein
MKVIVEIEPRITKSWGEFIKKEGIHVAIDGYVRGKTHNKITKKKEIYNFNHHEEVDRLSTRCTAAQIAMGVKCGLGDGWKNKEVKIWANDCDQDVCLSIWLIKNIERIRGAQSEPLINKLINLIDCMDTCAGGYPLDPNKESMQELNWIFGPYTRERIANKLWNADKERMEGVVESVLKRISEYSVGRGEKEIAKDEYKILKEEKGWTLVRELGEQARTKMLIQGIRNFVTVSERGNDYTYSIGKLSPFSSANLVEITAKLNKAEGKRITNTDCWGGGNNIIGSPRKGGSGLKPEEVLDIITGKKEVC